MKVSELKYTLRKNLGDYSYAELTATSIVEDGESANTSTEQLRKLVKWHLNADEYEAKYQKLSAMELRTDAETAWLAAYDERKKVIEAI